MRMRVKRGRFHGLLSRNTKPARLELDLCLEVKEIALASLVEP